MPAFVDMTEFMKEGAEVETNLPTSELVLLLTTSKVRHWNTICKVFRDRPGLDRILESRGRSFSQLLEQRSPENLSSGSKD